VTRFLIFAAGVAAGLAAAVMLQVSGEEQDRKAGRPCPVCGGRWARP